MWSPLLSWTNQRRKMLTETLERVSAERGCGGRAGDSGAFSSEGRLSGGNSPRLCADSPSLFLVPTLVNKHQWVTRSLPNQSENQWPGFFLPVRDSCALGPPPKWQERTRLLCGHGCTPLSRTCVWIHCFLIKETKRGPVRQHSGLS